MSKKARQFMGFNEDQVEIWSVDKTTEERKNSAVLLNIFHAYSEDLKEAKNSKSVDTNRIGFVTTKTWNRVVNVGTSEQSVWISKDVHDTVIGADPEFLLFDVDGNVVMANNIMNKQGIIGCDGAMAEIRPKPSITTEGLVKNIKSIFSDSKFTDRITKYNWVAGCYYKDNSRDYPIGGHIHIGNPLKVAKMTLNKRKIFFNVLNKLLEK